MSETTVRVEHAWEATIRDSNPVMICKGCDKVWWPWQSKPISGCKPKAGKRRV